MRVSSGRDFQARVMGDTLSNGVGLYAAANYMALTESATAPADGDVALVGELTAATANGLQRQQATYARTAGSTTYTLTKTFILTTNATITPRKIGVFNALVAGTLVFTTLIPTPVTMLQNDSLTITETVTL